MKVVQLVTSRQYRGAEMFAAKLSEQLVQKGITVYFVGLYPPPAESLSVEGAVNLDLNGEKSFLSLRTLRKLYNVIAKESPDIIQANGSDTLKYAVFAGLLLRKRVPIVYRNISIMSTWMGNSLLKRKFYTWLFSHVDFVTSVGDNSINDLVKLLNYPREKAKVIRRGIPLHKVDKQQARNTVLNAFDLPPQSRIVVHVGSFTPEKNQEFLIDVFNNIKKHTAIKLILVGSGSREKFIANLIHQHGLQSKVFMGGFRKDIDVFLSAAELLVMCSKVEGVPGVILEAGVQSTPCLAVDVGGVREVIVHDQTGIIHPSHDATSFAHVLVAALSDKTHLTQLGEKAREFVKTNFDSVQNAAIFVQLYDELTKGSEK